MKPIILFASLLASLTLCPALSAQPRFEVPLRVTDGVNTTTLYFGILSGAVFGVSPGDSINGHEEFELPPVPPTGVFDARFVWPRSGVGPNPPMGFGQGTPYDYRPLISAMQSDTFRVRAQLGAGTGFTISWPPGLSAYFTDLTICDPFYPWWWCPVNMLTDTSYGLGSWDLALVRIFSGGLVVSVGDDLRGVLPEDFTLHQNYPNPFNPSTTVKFGLPASGFVSLKVYDMLGREISALVEGKQEAGEHTVQWNPEDVSSGVYIYRLTKPGATISRKMLLLR